MDGARLQLRLHPPYIGDPLLFSIMSQLLMRTEPWDIYF